MTDRTRLEQLEGVVVEFGLKQDRIIAEQEKLQIGQKMMLRVLDHHSDQIGYLLHKQSELTEIVIALDTKVESLDTKVESLDTKVESLASQVTTLVSQVTTLSGNMDLVLTLLREKLG